MGSQMPLPQLATRVASVLPQDAAMRLKKAALIEPELPLTESIARTRAIAEATHFAHINYPKFFKE